MHFSHLNFLNAWGILAQRIFNIYAIFCGFSDVKNGEPSQQPSLIGQLVSDEPQRKAKLNEAYFFI